MSTFALENEDLCQALYRRIRDYKKSNPLLSSKQIARLFDMSSSTLNRIENKDIKTPSIDQVLKVLRGIGKAGELKGFIEEYYPDIADTYKKVYSHNIENEYVAPKVEELFRDTDTFLIMILAYTSSGTNEEEVQKDLGNKGLKLLRGLLKKGVLTIDAEGSIKGTDSKVKMNQKTTQVLLSKVIADCYQPENISGMKNFLSIQTSGINEAGALEIANVLKEVYSKVNSILSAEEFNGDLKYFVGLTSDFLNYKEV